MKERKDCALSLAPFRYAYILTHPGTPYVFLDHFHDGVFHESIVDLMRIRRQERLHCRSKVRIVCAEPSVYVACIDNRVYLRLGDDDWQLEDSSFRRRASGERYAIWVRRR